MNPRPDYALDVSRAADEQYRWWNYVGVLLQAAAVALSLGAAVLIIATPVALLIAGVIQLTDWAMRAFR